MSVPSVARSSIRSAPIRIHVIGLNYAPEPTGIAPYTTALAEDLAQRGHNVHAVTGFPHYPQWRRDPAYEGLTMTYQKRGVWIRRLRHPVPSGSVGAGRLWMELVFALRVLITPLPRPDVALVVTPSLLSVAAVLVRSRLTRTPTGVVVQDLYGRAAAETGSLGSTMTSVVASIEGWLLRRASGVNVIHDSFSRHVLAMGVSQGRLRHIRNWTHTTFDVDEDAVRRRRLQLGAADQIVAIHAGNMGVKQGLENLVDAGREAARRGLPIKFILLGDGSRREHLAASAAGLRNVEFRPPAAAEEFYETLMAADVLLLNELPGVVEMSVPSKLTSYFASGRPVVAAVDARGAAASEMTDAGAGPVVPSGDTEALLAAIMELAADPLRGQAHGVRARQYAEHTLGAQAALDAYAAWVLELFRFQG